MDGTSTYLTRDIGGAIGRYEQWYKFDKMIYGVGSSQDTSPRLFKILDSPWAGNPFRG